MFRFVVTVIVAALAAAPALADRKPTERETRRLALVLKSNGYVSWKKIALDQDDGQSFWEVDDAVRADGSKWDLKLRPQSLRIAARKREK